MKNDTSLFDKIVKITRKESSDEETRELLEEINKYRKKVPPFEATIFRWQKKEMYVQAICTHLLFSYSFCPKTTIFLATTFNLTTFIAVKFSISLIIFFLNSIKPSVTL